MRDSIMNTPEIKAMMEQANQIDKDAKKNAIPTTNPIPKITKSENIYWQNTLASAKNKLV
tara:strand:+ start:64349 stop:64528 length:180 start_codon:yes stop_codon:yes gene_type:complete